MALPQELEVQCLLCKELIKCQQNNTSILVDHVKLKHPDIKITNIPKELNKYPKSDGRRNKDKIVSNVGSSSGKGKITGNDLKEIMEESNPICDFDGNYIPKYTETKKTAKRRKFYKTSVETWKPGRDKILCPKCDAIVRPIIRTSADRVSHSTVGAALLMTCWPFCFFPFLFTAPVQENLHCSICGYYFGSYDYQKQTMNVPKQAMNVQKQAVNAPKQTVNVPKQAIDASKPAIDAPKESPQRKTENIGTWEGVAEKMETNEIN